MKDARTRDNGPQQKAVTDSMVMTKACEVRYRESDIAYSFQDCARRCWEPAMEAKFRA